MYLLPEPLALRDITPDDQLFLDALYISSREDLLQINADPEIVLQIIKQQQQVQTAGIRDVYPGSQHFIITYDGQAIGRVVLHVGERDIRLVDIAILPPYRNHGAGRIVLQSVQNAAQAQGLGVSMAVTKVNEPARHLYQSQGFVVRSDDGAIEQMVWPASRLQAPMTPA